MTHEDAGHRGVAGILDGLRVPVIAAPMHRVSGIELAEAACRAGVLGAFPTLNCRSTGELEEWGARLSSDEKARAPWCPNLIVHRSNRRLSADLEVICRYRPQIAITSVGSPRSVIGDLHAASCLVLSDVATLRHAHLAVEAGADGLVLLAAGAGGQSGWASPIAFTRAVRRWYDGTIVLAGGITDGKSVLACRLLGADAAYLGTRFLATTESSATPEHKRMVADSELDDIVVTRALTGLDTNVMRASLPTEGEAPAGGGSGQRTAAGLDIERDIFGRQGPVRAMSAGHSVSGVTAVEDVADVVDMLERQYVAALHEVGVMANHAQRNLHRRPVAAS